MTITLTQEELKILVEALEQIVWVADSPKGAAGAQKLKIKLTEPDLSQEDK